MLNRHGTSQNLEVFTTAKMSVFGHLKLEPTRVGFASWLDCFRDCSFMVFLATGDIGLDYLLTSFFIGLRLASACSIVEQFYHHFFTPERINES